ncbi:MAG TPA: SGNH/GDSL hydrolase family protein [Flavitalea sp.]|nr:SGNH/GDSL hydrolase family protein [Flavitalea sp.]
MSRFVIILILGCSLFGFTPKQTVWVAIGDSITYLNDHPDETGNRITKGYMTMVTEKLPNLSFINKGFNGWTSAGIAEKIDSLGLVKADVYTVFLGTNDWWQGRPIGTLKDYKTNAGNSTLYGSYRIIIDKLKSLNSHCKIILITPMQRGDFVYIGDMNNNAFGSYKKKNEQQLKEFSDAIIAVAEFEKIAVIDLYDKSSITQQNMVKFKRLKDPLTGQYKKYKYPEFVKIPFNPTTDDYPYPKEAIDMTYDGLHPSDKGYRVIAKMLIKELR